MSRISPVLGRPPKEGMKFGGNFRNYSHLWENDGFYQNASKGEKPRILEFLRRDHATDWLCAVADSGQKHTIPWAPINPAGRSGLVLFDETTVRWSPAALVMVDDMAALLTAGATKDEITSGAFTAFSWMRCPDAVRAFEEAHGSKRGGAEFALAIWLAQRDEAAVAERQERERAEAGAKKQAAKQTRKSNPTKKRKEKRDGRATEASVGAAHGGSADGDPRGLPGDAGVLGTETLGPDAESDAGGVADVLERAGVGDRDAPGTATPRAAQLDLFGAVGAGQRGGHHAARAGRVAGSGRA
jgi:hypothetical protein